MNHGTFAAVDNDRSLPQVPGRKIQSFASWDFNGGGKFYSPFPPFHVRLKQWLETCKLTESTGSCSGSCPMLLYQSFRPAQALSWGLHSPRQADH